MSYSSKKQFCPELDRIWHQTLNSYKKSSRPPKKVVLNNLEILLKALQHFNCHKEVIQNLIKSKSIIYHIILESKQKLIWNLQKL